MSVNHDIFDVFLLFFQLSMTKSAIHAVLLKIKQSYTSQYCLLLFLTYEKSLTNGQIWVLYCFTFVLSLMHSLLLCHFSLNLSIFLLLTGQSYKIGEKIGSYVFEDDPGLSGQPNSSTQDLPNKQTQQTAYRCKKCRRIIAVQGNVVSHTPGEGESCFQCQNKRKGERSYSKEQDCSSLFVEPLKWMTPGNSPS